MDDQKGKATSEGRDLRKDKRRDLGLAGSVKVHVLFDKESLPARSVDLSPGGVGLVTREIRQSKLPRISKRVKLVYRKGTPQELEIPAVVRNINFSGSGGRVVVRIGLSFGYEEEAERPLEEGTAGMVLCPEFFKPYAYCDDPIFFQEKLHFQVEAASSTTLRLVCSARNKSVFPGVKLELSVFLPLLGFVRTRVVAGEVRPLPAGDRYALDASFEGNGFDEDLARYLILSGAVGTVEELLCLGFTVREVEDLLRFRVAEGERDEEAVGRLLGGQAAPEPDARARYVLCYLGQTPLGVGRIRFVKGTGQREPGARDVPGDGKAEGRATERGVQQETGTAEAPRALLRDTLREDAREELRATGYVEVSWFCGERNPHIPDVFIHFIKHFSRMTLESGLGKMVAACQREAWPVYLALGFQALPGNSSTHPQGGGKLLAVLDVPSALEGKLPMDAKTWHRIFAPIAAHLGLPTPVAYKQGSRGPVIPRPPKAS